MKSPTVVGTDPYNSVQAIDNAIALKAFNNPGQVAPVDSSAKIPEPTAPTEEVEVRRAEAVKPNEQAAPVESTIKLDPPPPLQF
jgi:hypothetical protein